MAARHFERDNITTSSWKKRDNNDKRTLYKHTHTQAHTSPVPGRIVVVPRRRRTCGIRKYDTSVYPYARRITYILFYKRKQFENDDETTFIDEVSLNSCRPHVSWNARSGRRRALYRSRRKRSVINLTGQRKRIYISFFARYTHTHVRLGNRHVWHTLSPDDT